MPNIIINIPLYFTGITTHIYAELAPKLSATASVAQLVERWSRDPEGAGSIPSRRPWSCIFRNWSRLSLKMYIFTTLEFTTPNFKFLIRIHGCNDLSISIKCISIVMTYRKSSIIKRPPQTSAPFWSRFVLSAPL